MTTSSGDEEKGKLQLERRQARVELLQELSRARDAKKRLDLLISSPHAEALVPTLPAEDLFFTIKEVGLSDSVELVQLASPLQFKAFLDLDCWRRDAFDSSSALVWLRAARTDSDEERFKAKLAGLDMELIEMLLKSNLKIHDLQEDDDPEFEGEFWRSPEGRYVVEFLVDGLDQMGVKGLIDDMYAEDAFKAARLLEAVRWETPAELEEIALRWRTGRLSDMGFPELSEAMSYFSYVDPEGKLPSVAKPPAVPQGFFLARIAPQGTFFDKAAARVQGDDRHLVERQLVTVMNSVMILEGTDPGEIAEVERSIASARDTLSLGLEHAARGDPEAGAELLATAPLKRIFQIGFSLTLKLKYRADRLMKAGKSSLPGTKEAPLLDTPVGEAIQAVRRRRPMFLEALSDQKAGIGKLRPFRNVAELAETAKALTMAEKLSEVMEQIDFGPSKVAEIVSAIRGPELLGEVRFSELFLTAVARQAVGEGFSFAPLQAKSLDQVASLAFETTGKVKPFYEQVLRELVEDEAELLSPEHHQAAKTFADFCLRRLQDELGRPFAASGKLDPRYAGLLLLLTQG